VELTELAASLGYDLDRGSHSGSRSSFAMRHPATDDKIIVRRDRDGHWTYFSVRDDRYALHGPRAFVERRADAYREA
jgi:hypothetical protein